MSRRDDRMLLELLFLYFEIFLLIFRQLIFNLLEEEVGLLSLVRKVMMKHSRILISFDSSLNVPLICTDLKSKAILFDLINTVNLLHLNKQALEQISFKARNCFEMTSNNLFFTHMSSFKCSYQHVCLMTSSYFSYSSEAPLARKLLVFKKLILRVATIRNIQGFCKSVLKALVINYYLKLMNLTLPKLPLVHSQVQQLYS